MAPGPRPNPFAAPQTQRQGLGYRPMPLWQSTAAGGLQGIGGLLVALGSGNPQQALAGFQGGLQNFEQGQRYNEQSARDAQMFDMQIGRYQREDAKDQAATAEAAQKKAARDSAIDRLPVDDATKAMLKAADAAPSYTDLVPKPAGPQSGLAKLKADRDAGLIDQPTYDAAVKKENYISYPQGPGPTERERNAAAAGLTPGTPEYAQYLLGKDDTQPGPFQGTGLDAQSYNMVLTGNPADPAYAAAYAQLAMPRVSLDPVTGKSVIVSPDMTWARKPAGMAQQPPTSPTATTTQVPGATVTSDPGAPVYNETQGKAAGFADRMGSANAIFAEPDVSGAGQSMLQGTLSGVPLVGNYMTSADRQKFEQAERNFINAQLRRESGAVISPEEFVNARKQYIPQPGDSAEVLAQKAANRQQVIDAMAREGGPFYNKGAPTAAPTAPNVVPELTGEGWQ
jgi:hypothetical protein